MINYEERVAKGAALLDTERPGWAHEIDLERLDIANGQYCVTAQLAGAEDMDSWRVGMADLGLGEDTYIAHGFNAWAPYGDDMSEDRAYAVLNELWRDLISGRLAASEEGTR